MRWGVLITCLLLFFLPFTHLGAQDQEELVERTICVLDPVDLSEEPGMMESIGLLVSDTISVMLAEKGYQVIDNSLIRERADEQGLTGEKLLDKQKIIDYATELGADVVVNGVFRIEGQQVIIGVKAYDIFTGRIATGVTKTGSAGFAIYDTVDEVSELVAGKIREELKPLPKSVITVEREKIKVETRVVEEVVSIGEDVEVTFLSPDEGAQLYLGGEHHIGTIRDGKAVYNAKADTTLTVEVQKDQYHTNKQSFTIGKEDTEIQLKNLYRRTTVDLGVYLTAQKPLGANIQVRLHFIPDVFLLQNTLGLGYIPHSYRFADPGVRFRSGFFDSILKIELGWYPFVPATFPLRFMLYLGGLADLAVIPDSNRSPNFAIGNTGGLRLEYSWPLFSLFAHFAIQGNAWLMGLRFSSYNLSADIGMGVAWKL